MTQSLGINSDIRRVVLYRNGDENFTGKDMVFNRRHVRSIDDLLQMITDHIELDRAARSIHTPRGGTRIRSIDEISDRGQYVVVGYGRFKGIEYERLLDRHRTRIRDNKRRSEDPELRKPLKPVEHSPIRVSGRIRHSVQEVTPIFVFTNGDELTSPKKIILTSKMMRHWALIIEEINKHVQPQYSSTRALYTTEGMPVRHKSEIRPNAFYVAVSNRAPFKRMNYFAIDRKPVFDASPRVGHRNLSNASFSYYSRQRYNPSGNESIADSGSLPPSSSQSEPITNEQRSRARRRQNQKLVLNDGTEVLPKRPVYLNRHKPLPAIKDHRDESNGPVKAADETEDALSARQEEYDKYDRTDHTVDKRTEIDVEEEDLNGNRSKQIHSAQHSKHHNTKPTQDDDDDKNEIYRERSPKDNPDVHRHAINVDDDQLDNDINKDNEFGRENVPMESATDESTEIEPRKNSNHEDDVKSNEHLNDERSPRETHSPFHRTMNTNDQSNSEQDEAAIKIQAAYRGYQTRKHLRQTNIVD